MQPSQVTKGLNPSQHEAVTTDAAPVCILAGAGSGKTRVLTRRIAYRVLTGTADAPHVLALTFTRKAAGELRSRLASLGVRDQVVAGTFHSVAYAQLRRRWADRGERPPALLDRKVRLIAPLLGRQRPASAAVQPADVAGEIEWAKARMISPRDYERKAAAAGRKPPLPFPVMAALYERYEADKAKRGLVDFDDMLALCARALETDEEFAATQRWRFRHLFVDEFQDVNPVQFSLLTGWLGDRHDLCVVGDPNQAIYSWNGADPALLTGFARLFPTSVTVRLEDNYRSTPQVLGVANAVLVPGAERPSVLVGGSDTARGEAGTTLRATRAEGPLPSVQCYPTDVAEARGVAARIRRSHGPTRPWSHFAVLTRTNAQGLLFEEAFRAASIPFRVRGGGSFLNQPEIKEALAEMAGAPAAVPFSSRMADLEAMIRSDAGTEERRLSLEGLVRLAAEYASLDAQASVGGFSAWLAATVKGDEPEAGGDAVDIVTFHRAKGLEWPAVHVAGLEKGLVPIGRAETPEAEAEERRLLYVAITRARDELSCSWAERRSFGARSVSRSASPWMVNIEAVIRAMRSEGPSADWRRYLDRERTRLRSLDGGKRGAKGRPVIQGPGADPDPEVFAALKAWRAGAAKAANVPAYVIFHDTTLAAVAELRPRTRDALLGVPGLGPVKAERYGAALLALVSEHARTA
ncbi:MAG: UvrD-helicase domain-containing protein [Actinobacteria bacterium]|nr:UvrD-helicase domain-containing protein [Actinomycetota bacterium]